MKKEEIVDRFSEFLRENYYKDLASATTEKKKSLEVDFSLVDRFDPEMVDCFFDCLDLLNSITARYPD